MYPKPARPGGPPIFIGGNSPAALEPTARGGFSWLPSHAKPEELAQGLGYLMQLHEKHGTSYSGELVVDMFMRLDQSAALAEKSFPAVLRDALGAELPQRNLVGDPDELATRAAEYADAGVTAMDLKPIYHSVDEPRPMQTFAAEVMPATAYGPSQPQSPAPAGCRIDRRRRCRRGTARTLARRGTPCTSRRSTFSDRHWSQAETLPPDHARRVQDEALREQIAYLAARSAFYRAKFAEHGVDPTAIRTVDDLDGLPFTEKHELRDSLVLSPPLGAHVAAADQEIVQIHASSGTTGSPSYVGLTASDITTWCEMGARALYANGFRPGDRLLHAFGMSKGFVGGLPMVQLAQYMGIVDIPIGAEAGVERLLRVQADQRPSLVAGTPYFLTYLAEKAPAVVGREARDLGVRAVSVGGAGRWPDVGPGEPRVALGSDGPGDARRHRHRLPVLGRVRSRRRHALPLPDLMVAELIDPVTGSRVDPVAGAEGELVYTALRRQASPLLRFRTRDHVVVTGTDCACGRTGFKLRCVGRTDDMLIVRDLTLSRPRSRTWCSSCARR